MEQVQADGRDEARELAVQRLRDLTAALTARGFAVRPEPARWSLVAVNRAAEPDDPTDPLAVAYGSAKLVQRVALAADATGALCWYWQWSGPTRDAPGEYEAMCAADDVDEVARRVSNVLALRT